MKLVHNVSSNGVNRTIKSKFKCIKRYFIPRFLSEEIHNYFRNLCEEQVMINLLYIK